MSKPAWWQISYKHSTSGPPEGLLKPATLWGPVTSQPLGGTERVAGWTSEGLLPLSLLIAPLTSPMPPNCPLHWLWPPITKPMPQHCLLQWYRLNWLPSATGWLVQAGFLYAEPLIAIRGLVLHKMLMMDCSWRMHWRDQLRMWKPKHRGSSIIVGWAWPSTELPPWAAANTPCHTLHNSMPHKHLNVWLIRGPVEGRWMWIGGHLGLSDAYPRCWEAGSAAWKHSHNWRQTSPQRGYSTHREPL